MTAGTILKTWNQLPNSDLKTVLLTSSDTADATNTFAITLADFGIDPTGLISVESWVHTTSGSVITTELNTCAVSAGVLTITIAAGSDDDLRVFQIVGRADKGVFV